MQMDFLFSLEIQLVFGVVFLTLALGVASFVSGENPYPISVFIVGVVLIILSAFAVMYIENLKSVAAGWVESGLMSKEVFDGFDKKSTLFLFVFPFVTGAIGTNLLTEVVTRNFKFDRKLTFNTVVSGGWECIKLMFGVVVTLGVALIALTRLVVFGVSSVSRRCYPMLIYIKGKVGRRTELIRVKVENTLRNKFHDETQ